MLMGISAPGFEVRRRGPGSGFCRRTGNAGRIAWRSSGAAAGFPANVGLQGAQRARRRSVS